MQNNHKFSFDVFDTSIVRRVALPDDLHYLTARLLRQDELIDVDDRLWRDARTEAEHYCRTQKVEPTLVDIYTALAVTFSWTSNRRDKARKLEMRAELSSAFPIKSTLEIYRNHASRGHAPIFISDTVLRSLEISNIFEKVGLHVEPTMIYASCEQAAAKHDGTLYKSIMTHEMLQARTLQHLGDNYISDVVQARNQGVVGTFFAASSLSTYERAMLKVRGSTPTFEGSIVVGAARAARLSRSTKESSSLWDIATSVAGPVLTSFVLWTILDAKRRGIKRLFFLARDGQILARLGKRLCRWAKLDIDCVYLLASRQAFYLASLPDDPAAALAFALTEGKGRQAGDVLVELEFSELAITNILAGAGIDFEDMLTEENVERLKYFLAGSPEFLEFAATILERQDALDEYFKSQGVYDSALAAIVDLGWQGNLQLRLDRISSKKGETAIYGYYYSLYKTPDSIKERVSTYAAPHELFNPHLLETFCKADHKSVGGFHFDVDGKAQGLNANTPDDEAIAWGVHEQQGGIDAYCRCLVEGLELVDPTTLAEALRPAALASFTRFIRQPGVSEAHVYGSVRHAADQTHREHQELAPRLSAFSLIRLLSNPRRRRETSRWAGGLICRATDVPLGRSIRICLSLPERLKRRRHELRNSIRQIL